MLPEHEQTAFEEIIAGLGPLDTREQRDYLAPWWVPPAVLLFYGLLLTGAAVVCTLPALGGLGFLAQAAALTWAVHRRRHRPDQQRDRWPTPFIS